MHFLKQELRLSLLPVLSQSISYTEWLNSVVTADGLGEVILSLLPQIGVIPQYIKRTLDRRFVSFRRFRRHGNAEERRRDAKR